MLWESTVCDVHAISTDFALAVFIFVWCSTNYVRKSDGVNIVDSISNTHQIQLPFQNYIYSNFEKEVGLITIRLTHADYTH